MKEWREPCEWKRSYPTWTDAERAAIATMEDIRDGLAKPKLPYNNLLAYRCPFCNQWHVAHATSHVVREAINNAASIPGNTGWSFGYEVTRFKAGGRR